MDLNLTTNIGLKCTGTHNNKIETHQQQQQCKKNRRTYGSGTVWMFHFC